MYKFFAALLIVALTATTVRAQDGYIVEYPDTDTTVVADGTRFANLNNYFADSDFDPFYSYDPAVYTTTRGPFPIGSGTFMGNGGTTTITITQSTDPQGNTVVGSAHIDLYSLPNAFVGGVISHIGYMSVNVIPMDPFNIRPGYSTWFPIAFSPITTGTTPSWVEWHTTIAVPPKCIVVCVYQGTTFGTVSMGICPLLAAQQFIW